MRVTFYGVRGSIPVPGPGTARYGGNTSCLLVQSSSNELFIVDAGTGIRNLGRDLPPEGSCHLLLSHTHWDHIGGLPFFAPFYSPGWKVDLYVPEGHTGVLALLMNGLNFPLNVQDLPAQVTVHEYHPGQTLEPGSLRVETFPMPHPGGSTGLRLTDGWTLALSGDCEMNETTDKRLLKALLHDAHAAVVDGQYTAAAYLAYQGWGHSAREAWLEPACSAGVQNLLFTHHDADSTDDMLDQAIAVLRSCQTQENLRLHMAIEGSSLVKGIPHAPSLS